MNIPTSWQLDNCFPAGELWLPATCLPVSLYISCFWGAHSYFLPLLSVALLGFWFFFLKLPINLWMKNPFATEAN